MRTCIIVNPNAGSVEDMAELQRRLLRLPETGVRFTDHEGHAEEIARAAVRDGVERVVAAGGDGTLNEVVNGLAEGFGRVRLGLLPLGTGNDFARSINVPADLEGALAVLEEGRAKPLDVAVVTFAGRTRYFINMAAGGFGGEVSEKAAEAKERWGPLAYMRAALGALGEIQGFETTLTLNNAETLDLDTYNVVLSNGRYVAAGIPAAPQAVLDDGLLEVMIVPATTVPQIAMLVPTVLLGLHTGSDLLLF
ncbi:MAG TPA: diacylglycerol kinase family protein, partial [Thermoanaerobaculia bacterium]|nr:diacylglycerol kinase family protein [Thermoanaerobaculia bacterium]